MPNPRGRTPASLGFSMPAEWETHAATWLGWPHNPTDWPDKLDTIRWVYGEIVRKIAPGEAIQIDTKAAVDAIASISAVINQVNDISSTIATAVEEQNATTNEMSRNLSEAAQGSGEITSNIAGVAEAAQGTTLGATDTQKASQQLVETSTQLRRLVEQFKINAGENGAAAIPAQSRAAHAGS